MNNKEIVIRPTGCKVDICLRDRFTGEIEYLFIDVEDDEWISALLKECVDKIR